MEIFKKKYKIHTKIIFIFNWWGCVVVWGLGVRVPTISLFHDEEFAFFDFGVRGTP